MYKTLKGVAKRLIHSTGFEVTRLTPMSDPALHFLKSLERFKIDLVFDVGANIGQFSSELRSVGYKGRIVSFEPLTIAYTELAKASRNDPAWSVHQRCAIGDQDGEIEINISGNSVSSSVLPMTELCSTTAVDAAYVGSEKVMIRRLDSVATDYFAASNFPFLKIDTQGFEWQVLDGAKGILPEIRGVLCELSFDVLYKEQHLWFETLKRLEGEGFTLWSIQPVFVDPRNGRTLQVDATFFRL